MGDERSINEALNQNLKGHKKCHYGIPELDQEQSKQSSAACFMVVSCLAYSLTLKMEATFFSKTSVGFQWTTQHYILENFL
jgi:hypothetical protein